MPSRRSISGPSAGRTPALARERRPGACAKGIEQQGGLLLQRDRGRRSAGAAVTTLLRSQFRRRRRPRAADRRRHRRRRSGPGRRPDAGPEPRRFPPLWLDDDLAGVEVAGAVKNVLAIACGMVIGAGLGDNARAALITRGLAEVSRLVAGQRRPGRDGDGPRRPGRSGPNLLLAEIAQYVAGGGIGRRQAACRTSWRRATASPKVSTTAAAVVTLARTAGGRDADRRGRQPHPASGQQPRRRGRGPAVAAPEA